MTEAATSPSTGVAPAEHRTPAELLQALEELPFARRLSFEPLLRELDRRMQDGASPCGEETRAVLASLQAIPALRGTVEPRALAERADEVRLLMSFLFPEIEEDEVLARAYAPFAPESFYTTRRYREVFGADDVELSMSNGYGDRDYHRENLLFAYAMLFHFHYDVPHDGSVFVKGLRNTTTGLERFFQVDYRFRFVEVSYRGLAILPQAEFARLLAMEDLDTLSARMPLDDVVFSGFNTIRYEEITELHNLSLLKSELVEPGAFNNGERFGRIVQRLRSVLQVPDLEAGLALRYRSMQEHRHCVERSVLQSFEGCLSGIEETVYGEPIRNRTPLFVPDLTECDCQSEIVAHLRSRGVRSFALIPLLEDGDVIGILELTSREPEQIHTSAAKKLADLLPPLTIAARREMDGVRTNIERTLKTHCTAIHSSVAWRFEDAAWRYNQELAAKGSATFDDIVFENVFPLYGAIDIRGSSDSRNAAIQADLAQHLDLARSTLRRIHAKHPIPIAAYYDSVLGRFAASIEQGLSSGDETGVIDFLHRRVEPFFDYIGKDAPVPLADRGDDPIAAYYAEMDPSMRILYRCRKEYESSVSLINETLSAYLDEEEQKAQAIFPHYFEKYKTDGVEFNIYVGQSMTHGRTFDDVQLKNLRLWQIELMCGMARRAEALVSRMKVPLRTTPLVLVQSSPLTIEFRTESKQFEVEGSYNIRYEILKKRIDKSTVRGTGDRLTQPGQLSVIYTQDKEADEYLRYFEYMVERGLMLRGIEDLELEDLQGVSGLRALRGRIVLE